LRIRKAKLAAKSRHRVEKIGDGFSLGPKGGAARNEGADVE